MKNTFCLFDLNPPRRVRLLTSWLLFGAALAACGGGGHDDDSSSPTDTAAAPQADSAVASQVYRGIPAGPGLTGFYFNNINLKGQPFAIRNEAVDFDWGEGGPNQKVDNFSVRWSGSIEVSDTGVYVLRTRSDDGVRLWVDGLLVIDNWTGHAATEDTTTPVYWKAGQRHAIMMEYNELAGLSTAQLLWQAPGSTAFVPVPVDRLLPAGRGTGLLASYFRNPNLEGSAEVVFIYPQGIDFEWPGIPWGTNLPPDNFSVRWTGLIEAPASGTYELQTESDDGMRVWVDGQLVIDNWTAHAPVFDTSAPLKWSAGQQHAIIVEYQDLGGPGTARLLWRTPGTPGFEVVPTDRLYPTATGRGLEGAYFSNTALQGEASLTRTEAINFQWPGAPAPGLPEDGFSVRWRGWIEAPEIGFYMLQTVSDDGVRVWVDGHLVIDNWTAHAPVSDTSEAMFWSNGSRHAIVVEYKEIGGPGTAQLLWRTVLPRMDTFVVVPPERLYLP